MDRSTGSTNADDGILVGITSRGDPRKLVLEGHRLASAFGISWHVLHIEAAAEFGNETDERGAAKALSLATQFGATISSLPAATFVDGLVAFMQETPARLLVTDAQASLIQSGKLARAVLKNCPDTMLHLVPTKYALPNRWRHFRGAAPSNALLAGFWLALGVLGAVAGAAALRHLTSIASISLIFLFPVIAAAARYGIGAAIGTALACALAYNVAFVEPAFAVKSWTSQSWFMAFVLASTGAYTSLLTRRLRVRAVLSDRSARQNAGLAALATDLTQQSSWAETAQVLCFDVAKLFDLECAVLYDVDGNLHTQASCPGPTNFGPVDLIALDWCWTRGEPAGSGTDRLHSANWLFHPLKTAVGMLGVLAVARPDGRPPIGPGEQLLFATVVAQAALAHERLALEDKTKRSEETAATDGPRVETRDQPSPK